MSIPERCVLVAFGLTVALIAWRSVVGGRRIRKLLAELASHGGWLRSTDLAELTGIPEQVVYFVMRDLERVELVQESTRPAGPGCGLRPTYAYHVTSKGMRMLAKSRWSEAD